MADNASGFVWYHAQSGDEAAIKRWLNDLFDATGIRGSLFVRHADGKTTFMETYTDIGCERLATIESMASRQRCFAAIERRCESFNRII